MNDHRDLCDPSHPPVSDGAIDSGAQPCSGTSGSRPCIEPTQGEYQPAGAGRTSPPDAQRPAVRQDRPQPRCFVFSVLNLVTEDWEREGVLHVAAIDEASGLCWTQGIFLWWDFPEYCPAYMAANVIDDLLHVVPDGKVVLTVRRSDDVDYGSVEFLATILRLYRPDQEIAADCHWLDAAMGGAGASYESAVANLLGEVESAWDEAPHCVDELTKHLLACQGYEAVVGRAGGPST